MDSYAGTDRYRAWDLWKAVRRVQPHAVLLPPPPCGIHQHHRIVWGLRATDALSAGPGEAAWSAPGGTRTSLTTR